MELIKALNNNVALVYDDNKQEAVVMGSGVAFGLKPGGSVNQSRVEKLFVLDGEKGHKDFDRLLERISLDNLELASDIIKRGEQQLGYHCNDSILLTLSDHLGMMLERVKEGVYFASPLEWDIKLIYPKEYRYAMTVVKDLQRDLNTEIPEQEAAFIALHFINANLNSEGMQNTILGTKIIQNILNICKIYYKREFDEDDFDVRRFISHIRYFVQRQMKGEVLDIDETIAEAVIVSCPEDYKCSLKIADFLKKTYNWDISRGEILYLTLHLNRIGKKA